MIITKLPSFQMDFSNDMNKKSLRFVFIRPIRKVGSYVSELKSNAGGEVMPDPHKWHR